MCENSGLTRQAKQAITRLSFVGFPTNSDLYLEPTMNTPRGACMRHGRQSEYATGKMKCA